MFFERFAPQQNISTAIGQVEILIKVDIHGLQTIIPDSIIPVFVISCICPFVLLPGQIISFLLKVTNGHIFIRFAVGIGYSY